MRRLGHSFARQVHLSNQPKVPVCIAHEMCVEQYLQTKYWIASWTRDNVNAITTVLKLSSAFSVPSQQRPAEVEYNSTY